MQLPWKTHDLSRVYPEARRAASLLTPLHQGLQPQADAEKRLRGKDLAQGAIEPHGRDMLHAVANRALPREDDAIGPREIVRAAAHEDAMLAFRHVLEGLGDRAQVAHAVIENNDGLHRAMNGARRLSAVVHKIVASDGRSHSAGAQDRFVRSETAHMPRRGEPQGRGEQPECILKYMRIPSTAGT